MSSSSSPRQHQFRGSTAGTNILGAVHRMDSDSKKAENFSENTASHYDSFARPASENPVEEAPYDPKTNLLAPRPQFRRYRRHPNENPVEEAPYDPKSNLLAPRPQFLRYRPYPELYNAQFFKDACFLHPHDEDASRNSVLPEIKDIQSASGKTMDLVDMNEEKDEEKVALRKPVEEEEEEEEEYEEEVEEYEEEEEESSWSVSVSKVLFLLFMICTLLHVSVLRSPLFGKDGGEMFADSRASLRPESYQNEVFDKSFMRSHFDDEHKETDSLEQRILVYNSLDANEIYDKFGDLQIRNMYVWIQTDNAFSDIKNMPDLEQQSSQDANPTECDEHVCDEDLGLPDLECDERVSHEDPVQKSEMVVTETPDAFADLQKREIADRKVTSFQTEEQPVVEDVKKLRDDGIEGASIAEPVSQIFQISLRKVWLKGAVFSLSIVLGISAVLRILSKVFKKCRRILKDKEELKNLTSSSIVVEKSCSSLQNTLESSASTPTVRLLSEYLPEEFSSSGITRKRPARANQRSQKKERSISSAVQRETTDFSNFTDAPSFGSFTSYQNIKKRKSGGEEDKVVTSVRRSSRIRQMATSPRSN